MRFFHRLQPLQHFLPGLGHFGGGGPYQISRNVVLQLGPLCLLLLVQLFLPGILLIPLAGIGGVVAFIFPQDAVLYLPYFCAKLIQKVPVVRDHQQRTLIAAQVILQPVKGGKIQVVGRLVQNQQVWRFQKQLGDGKPGLFPAGKLVDLFIKSMLRKAHTGQHCFDLYLCLIAVAGNESIFRQAVLFRQRWGVILRHALLQHFHLPLQRVHTGKNRLHFFPDASARDKAAVLLLVTDRQIGSPGQLTGIRFQLSADDPQQGGFSGTVGAYQSYSVMILYFSRHSGKDDIAAKAFADLLQRNAHLALPFPSVITVIL